MGRRLTPEEKAENLRKKEAFDLRMDAYWKAESGSEEKLSPLLQALDAAREKFTSQTTEKARLLAAAKARYEQECRAISELDPQIESLRVEIEKMTREYNTARLNASREVNNAFPDLKGVNHWRNWIEPK